MLCNTECALTMCQIDIFVGYIWVQKKSFMHALTWKFLIWMALVMGGHFNELEAANITSNINWFRFPNFMSIRM